MNDNNLCYVNTRFNFMGHSDPILTCFTMLKIAVTSLVRYPGLVVSKRAVPTK